MRFDIKSDFSDQPVFQSSIKLMQRIGTMLVRNIIARTQFRNVNPNDVKFKRYSDSYAKQKIRKGGSGSIVNLKSVLPVSEHMVVSTDIVDIDNNSVEVGMSGYNLKKAIYNENMGRSFLGVSDDDEKDMDKIIDDYMDQELRKL